jgi:hypothetical protein
MLGLLFNRGVFLGEQAPSAGLYLIDTIPAQDTGLNVWTLKDYSSLISSYVGLTTRLVVEYTFGGGIAGDIQLDDIYVGSSNFYDPETGVNSFETNTTTTMETDYTLVSWMTLLTATTAGEWNRDSGGTPSPNTGNIAGFTGDYYYYAEVSGGVADNKYWLRSPTAVMNDTKFEMRVAQYGANCGEIKVYLEVI